MSRMTRKSGFSLIEMMIAIAIMGLVVAGTISGWLFVIFGERWNSTQDKLDLDVRTALEYIRRDLRLTTMNKMYFAPAGPGPYTAVSFPIAVDDDGDGLVELDGNTNIIWDITKIYHRYGTGMEFRVTTIVNRDNSLTDAQRQAQLDYILNNGDAAGTFEAGNASTRTLFKNLFTWNVSIDSAIFDSYNPTVDREPAMTLGSLILSNGTHSYKFNVVGKNPSSSGYKLGLDAMAVSASGGQREMEKQTISIQSGAAAFVEPMTNGSWSGNNHLAFPATATGQYVTLGMVNDAWEDDNFGGMGSYKEDTVLDFDTTLSPKDFVIKLDGMGYTWTACDQTKDFSGGALLGNWNHHLNDIDGCAVRILCRGGMMAEGGHILFDGQTHYVFFEAGLDNFRINDAFIARCASSNALTPDALDNGVRLWFSGTSESVDMNGSSWSAYAWPVGSIFDVQKELSYQISFLVDNSGTKANAAYWTQTNGVAAPGSYIIPKPSLPDENMTRQAVWSGICQVTDRLQAVVGIYSYYPTNGTYQSAVYDTHQDTPVYQDIAWSTVAPVGSTVKMKVRSGNAEDMSDAPSWTNLAWMASPGAISPGANRYVQYFAELLPTSGGAQTPKLKNVAIRFAGENTVVDIGGAVSKGPNYGIFELTVDGLKLQKGVTVAMQVYSDIGTPKGGTKRLVSKASVEVEPRNTGK
ncbi:MAG: prepilin-type N-terminal cleavage/methylation domain-containing protein [bacterium]